MNDVGEIRESLEKISGAVSDGATAEKPRFRYREITKIERADAGQLESNDSIPPEPRDAPKLDELTRQLDEAVYGRGIDALAWYLPFHISSSKWGIYIPITSVHYGAERWFGDSEPRLRRASMALEVILAHEVMHHICEYAVAQFELLFRVPCWRPTCDRLKDAGLEWFDDEEALANANSVRQLLATEPEAVVDRFRRALLQSPRGYRDFPSALSDEGFDDHRLEVLRHNVGIEAVNLKTGFLDPAFDPLVLFPEIDEALASCPLYVIDDGESFDLPPLSLRWVTCIPDIRETDRFQKMLRKLSPNVQEDWQRTKRGLANSVPRHPRFKKLKGDLRGLWGLYLNDGFRAHVSLASDGVWEALEIGSHKTMGHG